MKINIFLSTLLLSFQALMAEPTLEDQVKAAKNPDYYIHVVLTGVVKQMIFPGPPHFLSGENGDWAEPRTILKIDDASLLRLVEAQSRVTPNHYLGEFIDSEIREDESDANLVTLDSSFTEEPDNIELYENKIVTIDAVISAQPTRCHTPSVVEIVGIRLNKKRAISEYLVNDQKQEQWYLKNSAIAMAEDGRLHAIVVHAKTGAYLRPEYGSKSFKELLC